MTLLVLLCSLTMSVEAKSDTVFAVELYGLRSLPEASVRRVLGVRAGDPVPESIEPIRARLRALPGVAEVSISAVCCSQNGRTILYVGIREHGTPPITYRRAPTGSVRLPAAILAIRARFGSALLRAVQRGVTAEDHSRGYALAEDSALRSVQREFLPLAAQRLDALVDVLHNSADGAHRAFAAQIIAYAANRRTVARELLYAAGDPDEDARNNAVRALAVLAAWLNQHPQADVGIPAEPFVDFLDSVSWTDRNKGVMVLMPLTASRDSALLVQLRTRALPSLIEMARWANPGHAFGPFLILARLAGLDDAEAYRAWQAGEREAVIARAQQS